jgi:hypothetical protein
VKQTSDGSSSLNTEFERYKFRIEDAKFDKRTEKEENCEIIVYAGGYLH